MLPQNGHQNKYRRNEDDGKCDLRDRSRRERLDFTLGALRVFLLVPARECGKQKQAQKGEDDGNNAKDLVS